MNPRGQKSSYQAADTLLHNRLIKSRKVPEGTNAQSEAERACVVNSTAGDILHIATGHPSSCTNSCSHSYGEINPLAPSIKKKKMGGGRAEIASKSEDMVRLGFWL